MPTASVPYCAILVGFPGSWEATRRRKRISKRDYSLRDKVETLNGLVTSCKPSDRLLATGVTIFRKQRTCTRHWRWQEPSATVHASVKHSFISVSPIAPRETITRQKSP